MSVLDEFLRLQSAHDRRGRGRGRRAPLLRRAPGEQRTGPAFVEQVPIDLAHGAFVTSCPRRGKTPDDAAQHLNAAVNPRPADARADAVDEDARFPVVERAYDDIGP